MPAPSDVSKHLLLSPLGCDALEDQKKERWIQLCEQAAVEQNPAKLLALVQEINILLDKKSTSLKEKNPDGPG